MEEFDVSFKYIEYIALDLDIRPARYQKNQNIFSNNDQLVLLNSHVVVVGCGRLGSSIIEQLARLGVGKLTVFDPDRIQGKKRHGKTMDDNKMMQIPKVSIVHERIKGINPAVEIIPVQSAFDKNCRVKELHDVSVIIDTVDSIQTRIDLAGVCYEIGVPSINGKIENWFDYVTTYMSEHSIINISYNNRDSLANHGIMRTVNNLSSIHRVIMCFQLSEVCRIILGKKLWKDKEMLFVDTQMNEIKNITV